MKRIFFLLAISTFVFSACKKDEVPAGPDPVAEFAVANSYLNNNTDEKITVATYDGFTLVNNSKNGEDYLWEFGNGTNSTHKSPATWYTSSGTYAVTLTTSRKDGRKSVANKTIEVLDRVAKKIVVRSINAESALGWGGSYPGNNKLSVWVEILQAVPGQTYSLSNFGVPQAPLIYKTTVANNVDAGSLPLSFDISDKLIIDMPALGKCCGYNGLGFFVNFYAMDNAGTYLLASSYGSGVGFSMTGDIRKNRFEVTTGFLGTSVAVEGVYE